MEIVITENKVFETIYKYLDKTFNPNQMDWVYGVDDAEDEYSEPEENENFLIFYKGDWEGEDFTDDVFHYFEKEYYDKYSSFYNEAPILEVMGEHAKHLETMFGNHWEEPMKKWFQDNFNLPVKTVTTYY
jgi:hypothetical protein